MCICTVPHPTKSVVTWVNTLILYICGTPPPSPLHSHPPLLTLIVFICPVVGEWRASWDPAPSLPLGLSAVTLFTDGSKGWVFGRVKLAVTGL